MTSKPGKQTIAIHIFTNISRSKDNQAMGFGQLIEYNMRNVLLQKLYTSEAFKNEAFRDKSHRQVIYK